MYSFGEWKDQVTQLNSVSFFAGSCRVTIEGKVKDVYAPAVVEIPGDAQHMLEAPYEDLTFFYMFREGPFEKVIYHFEGERPAL